MRVVVCACCRVVVKVISNEERDKEGKRARDRKGERERGRERQ